MAPLSARQEAVLAFIRLSAAQKGYPPTVREIADQFGIRSPNGVACHLTALIAKGRIAKDVNVARGLRVL